MLTYKLHFIRHGLTEGNREGRYVGWRDLPVCSEGMQQLRDLTQEYVYPMVDMVYCSPLLRCRQTAEVLYEDAPLTVVDGLMEMNLGDYEGRLISEVQGEPAFQAWLKDSLHNNLPGVQETGQEFLERISRAVGMIFTDMAQNQYRSAAVITHGGLIMSLFAMFAIPKGQMSAWAVDNGTGFTVSMTPQMWMRDQCFEAVARVPEGIPARANRWVIQSMGADKKEEA